MRILDQIIIDLDKALRVIQGVGIAARQSPAELVYSDTSELSTEALRHSAALMRVNHVGEVCAQALYDAQGRFAHTSAMKAQFAMAAREEEDHLAWTAERVRALGSHLSILNPFWYAGAYVIGSVAARCGDAKNLGFVAETERQVVTHLQGHLHQLPEKDTASRAIVTQMCQDEAEHGAAAVALGAEAMPWWVKKMMQGASRVMTTVAYYV